MKKLITLLILCCGFFTLPALATTFHCDGGKIVGSGKIQINCTNDKNYIAGSEELYNERCLNGLKDEGTIVEKPLPFYKQNCVNKKKIFSCTSNIYGEAITCKYMSKKSTEDRTSCKNMMTIQDVCRVQILFRLVN